MEVVFGFNSRACTSRRVAFSDFSDQMVSSNVRQGQRSRCWMGQWAKKQGVEGCDADLLMSAVNFRRCHEGASQG